MLIAPTGEKKKWESKDAIGAWCLKCKEKIAYKVKDVNSVKRHIEKKHPNLLKAEDSKVSQGGLQEWISVYCGLRILTHAAVK